MKHISTHTKRFATLAALGLLAAAPAGPLAAPAAADGKRTQASTFTGQCQFEGVVRFSPPITIQPQPASGFAHAAGPCSGRFTDRRGRSHELDGDRVTYVAANRGEAMSCGGGTAEGGGYLRYRGSTLRFKLTEARGPGAALLRLEGARGGEATGEARVSEEEDPVQIAEKCMGPGLRSARIAIDLQSPGISG
jgi:hypothetical protein